MGRKSYNRTYEETLEIKRVKANKYYQLNREMINQKRRSDYHKLKDCSSKHNQKSNRCV